MKTQAERDWLIMQHESRYPDLNHPFVIAVIFSGSPISIDVHSPNGEAYVGSRRESIALTAKSVLEQFYWRMITDQLKLEIKAAIEKRFSTTSNLLKDVVLEPPPSSVESI